VKLRKMSKTTATNNASFREQNKAIKRPSPNARASDADRSALHLLLPLCRPHIAHTCPTYRAHAVTGIWL